MSLLYENQTRLGKRLGVTSHVVGRWLGDLGLRFPYGTPTPEGHKYAKAVPIDPKGDQTRQYYVWQVYTVLPLLIQHRDRLAGGEGGAS